MITYEYEPSLFANSHDTMERMAPIGAPPPQPMSAQRPEQAPTEGSRDDPEERPIDLLVVSAKWPPLHTGAGLQARAVLSRLAGLVRAQILTIAFPGVPRREESDGLRIERVGSIRATRPARNFGVASARRLMFIRPRPQLIWVLGVGPSTYAAILVGRLRRIPVLVKLTLEGQDDLVTLHRKRAGALRVRLLRSVCLVCPSTRLRRLALEMGLSADRVVHIPNGVDLARFAAPMATRSGTQLVFVGVVLERKGLHLLLEAMAELIEEYPSLHLDVVGEWPELGGAAHQEYLGRLRARLADPSLAKHVTIWGPVDQPEERLAQSSIFVLPSESEGLPNALLEAMAAGAVPVVSDLPALQEVVDDRRNGLIVQEWSSEAWAEAIRSLLREEGAIERLSRAARATVQDRYDLAGVALAYLDLFRRVAK